MDDAEAEASSAWELAGSVGVCRVCGRLELVWLATGDFKETHRCPWGSLRPWRYIFMYSVQVKFWIKSLLISGIIRSGLYAFVISTKLYIWQTKMSGGLERLREAVGCYCLDDSESGRMFCGCLWSCLNVFTVFFFLPIYSYANAS